MREQKPLTPVLMRGRAKELRQNSTKAERKLWLLLRDRQLEGLKFRRQQVIGPYIADFFCAEAKIVVESDGLSHENREEYDQRRTRYLESLGYKVLRFRDEEVLKQTDDVIDMMLRAAGK